MTRPEATLKATSIGAVALTATATGYALNKPLVLASGILLFIILGISYAMARSAQKILYLIRVERSHVNNAGEGMQVPVRVSVANPTNRRLSHVIVSDGVTRRLRAEGYKAILSPLPGKEDSFEYIIRPTPGFHEIKEATIGTGDPLGLFVSWRRISYKTSIKVLPLSIGELSVRGPYRGISEPLPVQKAGFSPELFQIREYVPGDDPRLIVWTATARTGKLMVREGIEESRPNVAVLVDLAAPSWIGTPGESAADWMMRIALTLLKDVARSSGRSWAVILRGEVWEEYGPLRASSMLDILRVRFSLIGPTRAERRINLSEALKRLAYNTSPSTLKVIMLGPGVDYYHLLLALKPLLLLRCSTVIIQVLPAGQTPEERAIRLAEKRYYKRHSGMFRELGVSFVQVESPGGAFRIVTRLLNEAARARCI